MASKILPVIMCGGAGTRVWPESRETMPKQFIALLGDRSTFQETVARVTGPMFDAPIVITNHDYRFLVKEQLDEIGAVATIVTEPVRRDSGPAVAVAATSPAERGPETIVAVFAADHVVTKLDAFRRGLRAGRQGGGARRHRHARRQADGAGDRLRLYPSRRRSRRRRFAVDAFVEKPDRDTAERYVAERLSLELRQFLLPRRRDAGGIAGLRAGDGARGRRRPWPRAKTDLDFLALDAASFGAAPKKSIDYAVMERTKRAAVVPADIGWSDVGNWDAVWKLSDRDADGNSFHGADAHRLDSKNVHVRSTGC